jgi:hypothetical protein
MRALRLVLKLAVLLFVVVLGAVSWETASAQGIGEPVSLTVTVSETVGQVSPMTDPIMSPAPPYCIVNVARSIEYKPTEDYPQWSYQALVNVHVPLREESCQFTYAIYDRALAAVRSVEAAGCRGETSLVVCGGVISGETKLLIEIFTSNNWYISNVHDNTNGVEFWWFFANFNQWHPITLYPSP